VTTVEEFAQEQTLASSGASLPPQRSHPALSRSPLGPPAWQSRLARSLLLLDIGLATAASLAALLVRFGDAANSTYLLLTLLFPVGFVTCIAVARGYEARFLGAGSEEYRRVADAACRFLALVAVLAFASKYQLARGYVTIAFPLATVLVLLGRYAARQHLRAGRRQGRYVHRVLVVGRERSSAELIRQLRRETDNGFQVVGACLEHSAARSVEGVPVVSRASDVLSGLRRTGADTVAVSAWSPLSQEDLRRLSWELEGTGVALVVAPALTDVTGPRIHIRPVSGLPLLHVEQPEFRGGRRVLKGAFDRSAALAALVLLAPFLLVIALLVRATSPGPALFRQVRVGKAGQTFSIYKFRSMRATAEQELAALLAQNEACDGLLFKIRQDPRITPVGAWLRRYSLDELPQLFNVIRGQMSLVGPRPPLADEVARYGNDVRRRLLVKPGLTGLWQVSGRSDLSWEQSVRLDLHYVENWSLALDLAILWRTVAAVLRRQGAY
jgi:exopolysaccharide biosynthesis polyprenyl glycosylphosphotransferase